MYMQNRNRITDIEKKPSDYQWGKGRGEGQDRGVG